MCLRNSGKYSIWDMGVSLYKLLKYLKVAYLICRKEETISPLSITISFIFHSKRIKILLEPFLFLIEKFSCYYFIF
jgi:hypothetical protein